MTSIKLKFRPSAVPGREGRLYFQVACRGVVRQVSTTHSLPPHEWDVARAWPRPRSAEGARRLEACLQAEMERLRRALGECERQGLARRPEVWAGRLRRVVQAPGVVVLLGAEVARLERLGRVGTARTFASTRRSLSLFLAGADCPLDALTPALIERYEAWLLARGLRRNTTSFYLRTLRTALRRASDEGWPMPPHLFRHVYTGFDRTAHRAVALPALRAIKRLDLSRRPALAWARDLFLFSFYTRGMPFVDMAFLRKADLAAGSLTYCRRKTRRRLVVGWEPHMQAIVERYAPLTARTPYLLPVILGPGADERGQYLRAQRRMNRCLKAIGRLVGLASPLTTYVARHSWASTARAVGIPLAVISEGMGHDSERTTRIYLSSLDASVVDRANRRILRGL